MFERLKSRIADSHRRDQEWLAEVERKKAEHEALLRSIDHIIDSSGGRARDYRESYDKYSDRTLMLLRDTFATDPKGLIELLWEAGGESDYDEKYVRETEKYIRERVAYPMDMGKPRYGLKNNYEQVRISLRVHDLTHVPSENHDGVLAALTVSTFMAENRAKVGLPEWGLQMTPDLAALILEMPDKVNDIIDYIVEYRVELDNVNIDHFRRVHANGIQATS